MEQTIAGLSALRMRNQDPRLALFYDILSQHQSQPETSIYNVGNETSSLPNLLEEDNGNRIFLFANTICICVLILFELVRYLVLGPLRFTEQQHLRETFWDYLVQKSLFVVFILEVDKYEQKSSWAVWFTILGSILLLSKLCKDRFEYLTSSPIKKKWQLIRICCIMTILFLLSIQCNLIIDFSTLNTHTLYSLADSLYVTTFVVSVIVRILALTYDMRPNSILEKSATITYNTDLFFSVSLLAIELLHHSHLLIVSHASIFIRSLYLMKIHTLLTEIRRRYKRHKHYLLVSQLMESNFANATKEEIEQFSDECAICWDQMENARKLPCGHLFHNSCLRSWLEQDTSCPTCRSSYKGQQQNQSDLTTEVTDDQTDSEEEFTETARTHQRNTLFHFDSSRYTNYPFLSWLPTIYIEGFM